MYSIRDAVIVALLVACIGLGTALNIYSKRNDALQAERDTALATAAAYKVAAAERATVNIKKENARVATEQVLQDHQEWADAPVPEPVADRLRAPDRRSKPAE